MTKKEKAEWEKKLKKLSSEIKGIENQVEEIKHNKIYENAFEWRFEFPEVLNEEGEFKGFDVIIGNPPYVQLQKNGGALAKQLEGAGYQTFERTGDIYTLFYEKGYQILKPNGLLVFITSNKWMRASYGESTRKFFAEQTNPIMLVDFAGQKIFDSATVDTNILMFSRDKNRQQTLACTIKEKVLNNLSDYFRQNASNCDFTTPDSWVVLSPIEQSIKNKIEGVGTPLKKWDINIYRGILTGYNEAFIIDGKTKDELIAIDPKSAEIIRPILRGRDIKRYSHNFANLWLINTHNGIKEKGINPVDIDEYPAIKSHLDKYFSELEKRTDKGISPYNLRNCAYMDDFYKQKIVWIELSDQSNFCLDIEGFFINNTIFFITGNRLPYILAFLNSKLCSWYFTKIAATSGTGTRRWIKIYVEQICVPVKINIEIEKLIENLILDIHEFKKNNINTAELEEKIDSEIYKLFDMSDEEIDFIKR